MTNANIKVNRKRKGQALLESALVTTTFFIFVIGLLDVGQVLFVHQSIVERVRAAARYGAVRPYDPAAIRNMVLYSNPGLPGGDGGVGANQTPPPGFMGLTQSMVTVTRSGAWTDGDRISITVDGYPLRFYNPLIAGVGRGKPIAIAMPFELVE
ncbi:MAG: pilus assembly protein [Bryobacteraceae bacterium]|nr:pilus assembly protein [Bryobacteraceae bacterium]